MSSRSKAALTKRRKPSKSSLPAKPVRDFRKLLDKALASTDGTGRQHGKCVWGVYAFYDYDGEPIYVGQTKERLGYRVRRHLTNQRTDAVAMRILDTFEVAGIELWPLWELADEPTKKDKRNPEQTARYLAAQKYLDAAEYSAYIQAIGKSRFKAILNEKIPPRSDLIELPDPFFYSLVNEEIREEREHPDVRIARRAETISRLAAVAHERGEVSDGLRRVLVIQAVRLAYLAATRLATVEGRESPAADAISVRDLVGDVTEPDDEGEEQEDEGDPELELE